MRDLSGIQEDVTKNLFLLYQNIWCSKTR